MTRRYVTPQQMLDTAIEKSLRYLKRGLLDESMTSIMSYINCDELDSAISKHDLEGETCEGLSREEIIERWIKGFYLP